MMDSHLPLSERVRALFAEHGARAYDGARRESVTALEHALQCAQLAEWAGAPTALVVAALLHDIGHFAQAGDAAGDETDDAHEMRALPWLGGALGAEVTEPIRLHVAAKRYLVVVDPLYSEALSPASQHSLQLQGGPMSAAERAAFEATPFAPEATLLRRWDDAAKTFGKTTASLDWYLPLIDDLCAGPLPPRIAISAFDAT
jgi:phosphonate degradation associated HDIG domain protein